MPRTKLAPGAIAASLACLLAACAGDGGARVAQCPRDGIPAHLSVATYNTSLNDDRDGGLIARLRAGDANAAKIAAVIQHERPDLLLLNEFDYDPEGRAAALFLQRYLAVSQHGQAPIQYPYHYIAPVNTGVPSGMDLDRDGRSDGPNDAWGFGKHPGQYGMLVLSKFPIDATRARTFQRLRWSAMPGVVAPVDPATGQAWYPPEAWSRLRLSSKSHWDLPVRTPLGRLHFLVSHPTPPVFDGPEDRNGARNRDEIRLWDEYISGRPTPWLCDDRGRCGGLAAGEYFVIAGDQNSDPHDGDTGEDAIARLLANPRVQVEPAPESAGAALAAKSAGGGNVGQRGPDEQDTGDFGPKVGNLRLDYVLPSRPLQVPASKVFWPAPGEVGADWIDASDHHMVFVDIAAPECETPQP
jgi:endonuclease/exonuclease/phosphatase family metal-dependent hydrolase